MADIITTNLDAGTDSPAAARPQLLEAVQKLNALSSAAVGGGASLVFYALTSGSTERTAYEKFAESITIDDFGAVPNDESSAATNAAALTSAYVAAELAGISTVSFGSGGTYWLPPNTTVSRTGFTLDCRWALLKQQGHATDASWLLITGCSDFRMINFRADANRANTATVGPDRAAILVFNCSDITISDFKLTAAKGKGLAVSSGVTGSGALRVTVRNGTGGNCGTQVFIADGSTGGAVGTPPCEDVTFDKLTVTTTDHAGIAINDGARHVVASNCYVDNNNATWDAFGLRGSRDVKVIGCTGRRGRNGIQVHVLDAASIARGEESRDIQLIGNTWELNKQSGCLIAGAIGVTVVGDIGKNNGQSGAGYRGFHVTQVAGVRRSSRVRMSNVISIDDQGVATQSTAIEVSASDDVRISSPTYYGNITDNRVKLVSGVTLVDVIGDGADGATRKRGAITTGTIAASSQGTVTFTFTTPFDITPTWVNAAVLVGSGTRFLKVQHVQALTTAVVQVLVSNDTATDIAGTLYVEAAVLG